MTSSRPSVFSALPRQASSAIASRPLRSGSAPKHAGKNRANPSSLLLSGVMLLEHLGWHEAAERINRTYATTIAEKTVTYDFARLMEGATEVSTRAFADALIGNLT